MDPILSQNGCQNPLKNRLNSVVFFASFLDRFSDPKTVQNQLKIHKKSTQNRIWLEKLDFSKNSTSPRRDTHFGGSRLPNTPPKVNQKGSRNQTQIQPKFRLKFIWILERFQLDFGSRVESKSICKI